MLRELRVENLLLIERAQLELSPGLNVLTGETGAGKTMLAHALDLLLGGKPRRGIVRPGAREAYVEGSFMVGERLRERLPEVCMLEEGPDGEELVLARRVGVDGRTRAYLNGRTATVGDLRAVAEQLIVFYGQHEHRKLTLSTVQLEILDELCGPEHLARRRMFASTLAEVRSLEAELNRAEELASARGQELELLEHELAQIAQVDPLPDEQAELTSRRERLRRLDALRSAVALGAEALAPEDSEHPGAVQLAADAAAQLDALAGVDGELDHLSERLRALSIEAQDIVQELHRYQERLESEDGELQSVEERLAALERLMRRHGGTIDGVLQYATEAGARLEELRGAESAGEAAAEHLAEASARLDEHLIALRQQRQAMAGPLSSAVREQLAALAMGDATFDVELAERELTSTGGDAVEFMLAPNPGVAAAPLREIASGGELSRVMLAVSTAFGPGSEQEDHGSSAAAILVFDEVDAGIGGLTARAVGERLRTLGQRGQVLCITHLPQIASLAKRHFTIVKDTGTETTTASVLQLTEPDVVSELVRMLGAEERDAGARKHAKELRRAA